MRLSVGRYSFDTLRLRMLFYTHTRQCRSIELYEHNKCPRFVKEPPSFRRFGEPAPAHDSISGRRRLSRVRTPLCRFSPSFSSTMQQILHPSTQSPKPLHSIALHWLRHSLLVHCQFFNNSGLSKRAHDLTEAIELCRTLQSSCIYISGIDARKWYSLSLVYITKCYSRLDWNCSRNRNFFASFLVWCEWIWLWSLHISFMHQLLNWQKPIFESRHWLVW